MLEPGKWLVRVKNVAFKGNDGGGSPQLAIYFEDDVGESITWYSSLGVTKDGSFSQAGCDYAMKQLRAMGWDAEKNEYGFERLAPEDVTQSPIFDVECEIVVVAETFEGKSRIKVKFINDPNDPRRGGGLGERMEASAAQTFSERVRAGLRQSGKSVPTPSRTPQPAPRSRPTEEFSEETLARARAAGVNSNESAPDDIPF